VSYIGEKRNTHSSWWEKLEGNRPLGRPRHRHQNIKRDLRNEIGGYRLLSSGSGEGQMVGSCKHGDKPSGSTKCGEFFD
jgi:hypothetical protein